MGRRHSPGLTTARSTSSSTRTSTSWPSCNAGSAAGDTAQAYILAHEVGHHVQHQLGITEQVQSAGTNEASVALEPGDCFAGVGSTLKSGKSAALLESGDLEEALNAAAAVGDDAIQQQTTGGQPRDMDPRQLGTALSVAEPRIHLRFPQQLRHIRRRHLNGEAPFGSVPLGPIYRYRGMMSG